MNNKYYWSMAQNRSWLLMLYGADPRARIKPQRWLLRVVSLQLASGPAVVRGHTPGKYVQPKMLYALTAKRRGITAHNAFVMKVIAADATPCDTSYNTSYISRDGKSNTSWNTTVISSMDKTCLSNCTQEPKSLQYQIKPSKLLNVKELQSSNKRLCGPDNWPL